MQALAPNSAVARPNAKKFIIGAFALVILFVFVFIVIRAYQASRPASLPPGTVVISQSVLEAKYGLRVNLLAVTGAGGFVDVRLKMVDAEKARLLLADAKHFPALFTKSGVMLN